MKTVLITGATGFIGFHLVEAAIERGFKVIAAARKSSDIAKLNDKKIPVVILNLANLTDTQKSTRELILKFGKIDTVIHAAGLTQGKNKGEYYRVNQIMTTNLVSALAEVCEEYPKFIFISSIAAMGPGGTKEKIPKPVSHYGKSKLAAETSLKSQTKMEWVIVRPTAVYGEGERNFFKIIKTINMGIEVYSGTKNQQLSFIYIHDIVEAIFRIMESNIRNEIFNLSDGLNYNITDVYDTIKTCLGRKTLKVVIPIFVIYIIALLNTYFGRFSQKMPILNIDKYKEIKEHDWTCDNSYFVQKTGYKPEFLFAEGIKRTINWYRKNDWL